MSLPTVTRQEKYLAYLNGDTSVVLPKPVTNVDYYLYNLCMKGGTGGGGVTSWNDLTDKPFYTTIEETTIIDRQTFPVIADGYMNLPKFTLFVGETYKVNWNSTVFTCVAQDITEKIGAPVETICIGNIGAMIGEEGTGEPFVIMVMGGEYEAYQAVPLDGSASARITLSGKTYVYHKLDDRYINNNTVYVELSLKSGSTDRYTMIYQLIEIYNMIMLEGKNVILSLKMDGNAHFFYPSLVTPDALSFQTFSISDKIIITELQYLKSNGYWTTISKSVNFA